MSLQSFNEFSAKRKQILIEEKTPPKNSAPDEDVWKTWRTFTNMSASELKNFLESDAAHDTSEKEKHNGRDSANMLLKMIPDGSSFENAKTKWTATMWEWSRKQNAFNSRMKGSRKLMHGDPFEKNGQMTQWLKSLLFRGHDPRKPLRKV